MSLAAMVWAMNQTTGSPQSKLVLLKLADNANSDTGVCWPSLASIARVTEMNRSTVIRHIKKLNELGLIVTIHRSHEGVNLSNHYRLLMVEPSIMSENKVTRGDCTLPLPPSERDQDDGGVQPRVVAERDPNQSLEPVIQPPPVVEENFDLDEFLDASCWGMEHAGKTFGPNFREHLVKRFFKDGLNAKDHKTLKAYRVFMTKSKSKFHQAQPFPQKKEKPQGIGPLKRLLQSPT